jgi:hypothetical protein
MSYLRCLCLFTYNGDNTYCVMFLFCLSSSYIYVLYVASSGLSILIALRYSLTFIYI